MLLKKEAHEQVYNGVHSKNSHWNTLFIHLFFIFNYTLTSTRTCGSLKPRPSKSCRPMTAQLSFVNLRARLLLLSSSSWPREERARSL